MDTLLGKFKQRRTKKIRRLLGIVCISMRIIKIAEKIFSRTIFWWSIFQVDIKE